MDEKKNMETEHIKALFHSDRAVLNGSKVWKDTTKSVLLRS